MAEKTPRLLPHHFTMTELAKKGAELYHPPQNPYIKQYQQKLGQMSMLDVPRVEEPNN